MRRRRFDSLRVFLVLGLVGLEACSHSGPQTGPQNQEQGQAWVSQIALANLHYRRPEGPSASQGADPWDPDFTSHPLPDARLDCKPIDALFAKPDLTAIRDCFSKMKRKDFILTFSLRKSVQPALVLIKENPDKLPKGKAPRPVCVDQLLSVIPVPREIVFQGLRGGQNDELGCFASGLKPDSPPILGIRLGQTKTELAVDLSSVRTLESDADVRNLLVAWVLRPFWDSQRGRLAAKLVPDRLCRQCLGENHIIRSSVPTVPLWPPSESQLEPSENSDPGPLE